MLLHSIDDWEGNNFQFPGRNEKIILRYCFINNAETNLCLGYHILVAFLSFISIIKLRKALKEKEKEWFIKENEVLKFLAMVSHYNMTLYMSHLIF